MRSRMVDGEKRERLFEWPSSEMLLRRVLEEEGGISSSGTRHEFAKSAELDAETEVELDVDTDPPVDDESDEAEGTEGAGLESDEGSVNKFSSTWS